MFFSRKIGNNIAKKTIRFISGVKRKYPLDPDHVNKVPISEYPTSKKTYRRIFSWGNCTTGALGIPYLRRNDPVDCIKSYRYPKRVTIGEKFEVTSVAAGFGFTVFSVNSDTDVKLYGTGINTDSQIGYHAVRKNHPLGVIYFPQPIPLPFKDPKGSKVKKIAAGRAHLIVLTDEGIFLMGNNSYGQCGRRIIEDENYSLSNYINHLEYVDGKRIIDVECGQDHSLVITEDGSVYSCGWGADGQTGLGHFNTTSEFTKIRGDIENERILQLSCRSDFVLAFNDKGEVFGWGNTEYGQISTQNEEQQVCHPTYVKMLSKCGNIASVASAGCFCIVANDKGEVFTWGYGLLGVGPNVQMSKTPLQIPATLFGRNEFQPNSMVKKVRCGLNHAAAVTTTGDLYTWGRNKNTCLGLRSDKDQYFPLKVCLSGYVEDISCGIDHSVAICKPFI